MTMARRIQDQDDQDQDQPTSQQAAFKDVSDPSAHIGMKSDPVSACMALSGFIPLDIHG